MAGGDKAVHICTVPLSLIRCMHVCVFLLVKHHLRGNRYILVGVWRWEGELVCATVDKFTPFYAITVIMSTIHINIVYTVLHNYNIVASFSMM